jgi:hypothetical protein
LQNSKPFFEYSSCSPRTPSHSSAFLVATRAIAGDTDEFRALSPIPETSAFTELPDSRPIERWSSSAIVACIMKWRRVQDGATLLAQSVSSRSGITAMRDSEARKHSRAMKANISRDVNPWTSEAGQVDNDASTVKMKSQGDL